MEEEEIKKIKLTVPYFIKEKLKEDQNHFNLPIGRIGNKIFDFYANKDIEKIDFKSNKGETIQFNLNTENDERYYLVLKEQEVENEAEFFRNLIFCYLGNQRYQRERILFIKIFKILEEAIKNNKKINIKYKGELRTVNPYFIKVSPTEDRAYLFSYCEKNKEFRNYRIANINKAFLSKQDIEFIDIEYINKIDQNFDAFLSYGKLIKIKINDYGKKLFEQVVLNRPKVLEKIGDVWTLECTKRLAKIYFPQFMKNIEVLEPIALREWFIKELKDNLSIYEKEE